MIDDKILNELPQIEILKDEPLPSHGLPVILYDADAAGTKNYLALAKEIVNRETN